MVSREAAKELTRKTDRNSDDNVALHELLEKTNKNVDARFDQIYTRFDNRFTRLEQLLGSSAEAPYDHRDSVLRTPLEKKLSSLDEEIDTYSRRTFAHTGELERHNRIFDVYDKQFDAHEKRLDHLGSQLAQILEILRGKPE